MFFTGDQNISLDDVRKMSVAKLAEKIRETFDDDRFFEMNKELFDIDPTKDYKKVMETLETFVRSSRYKDKAGFDMNTLAGIYNGVFYGMAIVTKVNVMVQGEGKKDFESALKLLGTFFGAIEEGGKNIKDDKWFENLMKNVKVVPDALPKEDKKKKK